jgi:hypothetical protein
LDSENFSEYPEFFRINLTTIYSLTLWDESARIAIAMEGWILVVKNVERRKSPSE